MGRESHVVATLLAFTVGIFSQPLNAQGKRTPDQSCVGMQWSSPQDIVDMREARGAFSILSSPDMQEVVVGTALKKGNGGPSAHVLVLLKVGGQPLLPPDDAFSYLNPRAIIDRDGRLHLLWGEPGPEAGSTPRDRLRPRALWHALYRDQQGWSQPTLLHEGGPLVWNRASATLVATPDAGIHTVISERTNQVIYVRIQGSEISKARLPTTTAHYSDILAVSDSLLLLAYVGWNPDQKGEYNRVMILRSMDQGRTWSEPLLVHSASDGFAQRLWLLKVGPEIIALWSANARGGVIQDRLRMGRSVDQGATWSPVSEYMTEDEFGASWVAASSTRDGSIVAAWLPLPDIPRGEPIRIECWKNGAWSRTQAIATAGIPTYPALSRAMNQPLELTWTEYGRQDQSDLSRGLRMVLKQTCECLEEHDG